METYGGSGDIDPAFLTLTLVDEWLGSRLGRVIPGKEAPAPIR
jgi:hypothetical protein